MILYMDEEDVRIILSSVRSLGKGSTVREELSQIKQEKRIYIKLPDVSEQRLGPIYRIANFNRGSASVIIFDESNKKYVALKGITMAQNDKVRDKLTALFGDKNVVFK